MRKRVTLILLLASFLLYFIPYSASMPDVNAAPTTPTNLVAQRISPTGIKLMWNNSISSSNISGYKIMRNNQYISSVTNTSFQDSNLSDLTIYNYSASAVDANGNESQYSLPASISTLDKSDTNLDGSVGMGELEDYMDQWKTDSQIVNLRSLIRAIGLWKMPHYIENATVCSNIFDQSCPPSCSKDADSDCCLNAGGYWLKANENGSEIFGCYNVNYHLGCSPAQLCSDIVDGCCPNWCVAGTDADCCIDKGYYWLKYHYQNVLTPPQFILAYICSDKNYNPGCDWTKNCSVTESDGCCPNWCSTNSDLDCCSNKGYFMLAHYSPQPPDTGVWFDPINFVKYGIAYNCYPTNYSQGCDQASNCSQMADGCCPNWCSSFTDSDCCIQAGKYWLCTNSWGYDNWTWGCFNTTNGNQTNQQCAGYSPITDGYCPPNCPAASDADCCTQSGKYWLQTSSGWGCYTSYYNPGCSPRQACSGTADSCCPNWCSAGIDADCCIQAGKCWNAAACNQCV